MKFSTKLQKKNCPVIKWNWEWKQANDLNVLLLPFKELFIRKSIASIHHVLLEHFDR